jgi:hypothetical protein
VGSGDVCPRILTGELTVAEVVGKDDDEIGRRPSKWEEGEKREGEKRCEKFHRESIEGLLDFRFLWFLGLFDGLEVALFAAADESLGVALQPVPAQSDRLRFVGSDGMVEGGFGNAVEKLGELVDDLTGGGEDFESVLAAAGRISNEVAVALLAEPLHDAGVAGESNDLEKAIEGIAAAASRFGLLLSPLVDQRKRDAQFGSDCFGAGLFKGVLEDLVRFHGEKLG